MDHAASIRLLTDSGAMIAASHREHDAIEDALDTLGNLLIVGATRDAELAAVDLAIRFFETHFASEEAAFADSRYLAAEAHIKAHARMLCALRRIRADIEAGKPEAELRFQDLLNAFHNHVDKQDLAANAALLTARMQQGNPSQQDRLESERLQRRAHSAGK